MANFMVGVDFGTGGAKAVIIDDSGQQLSFAFEEYPIYTDNPGWSEHDAPLYWEVLCRLVQKTLHESCINHEEIRGVAISSALPSVVFIDKDGNPLPRAYNLMDRRATKKVDWLKENIGAERIFNITANRLEDHPALVNLLWVRENQPGLYKTISKLVTIDGFISYKLTAQTTLNYSAASFFGVAYNIVSQTFDQEILGSIGVNQNLIPRLCKCEEIIGDVTHQASLDCGLPAGTPVAGGQVDCNAGWLQGGAIEPGDFQMNLGTCGNFGIIHRNRKFLTSEAGASSINFAYTVNSEDTYITVPTTTTGGQTLRYLRDNFSPIEVETERTLGINSYDLLNLEAQNIPLGCNGLMFLPYLMGERTPIWDVNARGLIFGLSLNHTKGHLVRAAMEGVAFALYHSFETLSGAGLKVNFPLVLNEGGAKSTLWRRIITDVFDVETVLLKRRSGAPFGDAILAGVATGVFKDFSVAKQWAETIDPMEPIKENHSHYMEYFSLFKSIYQHVKGDFIELARLRN
jgi:xylulokinase